MRYLLLSFICLLALDAHATTYFSFNGESGYQYMGSGNAHPGGGYFQQMGGNVSKSEGTYSASNCAPDTNNYHFSVISNETKAQGASIGSQYSLKTPYLGVCPNESFSRDTTIIRTPLLSEYYLQWKQKWTGSFQNSVQQKFLKAYNSSDTLERTMSAYTIIRPRSAGESSTGKLEAYFNNIGGLLNRECILNANQTYITPVPFTCYEGQNRSHDSSSDTTTELIFELNRWYTIEIHSKFNSANDVADAVFDVWIDGVLRLSLRNFKMKDGATYNSLGTDNFEFQHVYYDRSSTDQTTYMDDIVIADTYIGTGGVIPTPSPTSTASGRFSVR